MEIFNKGRTRTLFFLLISGLILCFMGFYNKYPLLFYDTGTYVLSGFKNIVPNDRPILYGLFIRHISLAESLWLVIFFQGIILSITIYLYFKYLAGTKKILPVFLFYIFLIAFLTGASVTVSQLMPDVFASVTIMCLGLLILAGDLGKRDLIIISILIVIGISVHNSHLILAIIITSLFTVLFTLKKTRTIFPNFNYRRQLLVWSLIVLTFLSVSFIHLGFGGGFTFSK